MQKPAQNVEHVGTLLLINVVQSFQESSPHLTFGDFLSYLAPIKQHKIIFNGVGLECKNVLEIWGEILGKCISKNWEGFVVISRSLGWPTPENLTRHFLTLS